MLTEGPLALSKDDVKQIIKATTVLNELRSSSDIPESVWRKAECVPVIPSLKKAAFIVGGEHGSGVMSCRRSRKTWGPPLFMDLTKASAGNRRAVDYLVLLVMNKTGVNKLLGNKVTLGADASVAAGPVGRTAGAATDVQLSAEMLWYSHSKGLFAGVNLSGGSLSPDKDANTRAYGAVSARDIAMVRRGFQRRRRRGHSPTRWAGKHERPRG